MIRFNLKTTLITQKILFGLILCLMISGCTINTSIKNLSDTTTEPTSSDKTQPATQMELLSGTISDARVGQPVSPAITITLKDADGNVVTDSGVSVTLSLLTDPTGSATLGGTLTVTTVNGVATFSNITIDKVSSGFVFKASSPGLADVITPAFEVRAGPAAQLRFVVQPVNTGVYELMNKIVKVEALDSAGNRATDFNDTITLDLKTDPVGGSILFGKLTMKAILGLAEFPPMKIDEVGNGFVIRATASGLTSVDSSAFNITAGAIHVFRSVGEDTKTTGTISGRSLTIVGNVATFSGSIGFKYMMGDAIAYDSTGSGARDKIAFVCGLYPNGSLKVKTASGGVPTAVSNDSDWEIARAYYSLTAAEGGVENMFIDGAVRDFDTWSNGRDIDAANEVWNIYLGTKLDVLAGAITIDGWTTAADNYLNVYSPRLPQEADLSGAKFYHGGVIGSGSYTPQGFALLVISDDYVRIDGMQFRHTPNGGDAAVMVSSVAASSDVRLMNLAIGIDQGASSGAVNPAIQILAGNVKVINSIISGYHFVGGNDPLIVNTTGTVQLYNNTIYGGNICITRTAGTVKSVNNLVQRCKDGFSGTFAAGTGTNSSNTGDAPSSWDQAVATFANVSGTYSNVDLKPAATDIKINYGGSNLLADSDFPVLTDIQNNVRRVLTSVGAYQVDPQIIRSVGFDKTEAVHNGQSYGVTVSVTGFTATFSNFILPIHPGDILQYHDGTQTRLGVIYFQPTGFGFVVRVMSAVLDTPFPTSAPTNNWKIFRAHTSLNNALNRIENTGLDSSLRDFDRNQGAIITDTLGVDWLIVPVADALHAQDVNVPPGWGSKLYMHVFGQRHVGVWADTAFRILGEITASSPVKIDGFQIEHTGTNTNASFTANNAGAVEISRSLFRATGKTNVGSAIQVTNGTSTVNASYNIIYDYKNTAGNAAGLNLNCTNACLVTNNTIYNVDQGIKTAGTAAAMVLKNNLVQNSTDAYDGNGTDIGGNVTDLVGEFPSAVSYNSSSVTFTSAFGRQFSLNESDNRGFFNGVQNVGQSKDAFGIMNDDAFVPSGAFNGPIMIFRSMGYNKTTVVTSGGGTVGLTAINTATGKATFSAGLPNTVGVGDVLIFKITNSGASDAIAFISKRLSSSEFILRSADGRLSGISKTGTDTAWSIYRAYISPENINTQTENTGISAALRDFDTITSKSLSGLGEAWNLAFYADAVDTSGWSWNNTWNSNSTYFLRIFTPVSTFEVGASQRHNGIAGATGYVRQTGSITSVRVGNIPYSIIDGLQIQTTSSGFSSFEGIKMGYNGGVVKNSLIYDQGNGTGTYAGIDLDSGAPVVFNNIVLGYTVGFNLDNHRTAQIYNNTVHATDCITGAASTYRILAINNVFLCTVGFPAAATYITGTGYNVAQDAIPPGTGSFLITQALTDLFVTFSNDGNYTNDNFHIKNASSQIVNAGSDLSNLNLNDYYSWAFGVYFNTDIDGATRSGTWDIGADEL